MEEAEYPCQCPEDIVWPPVHELSLGQSGVSGTVLRLRTHIAEKIAILGEHVMSDLSVRLSSDECDYRIGTDHDGSIKHGIY